MSVQYSLWIFQHSEYAWDQGRKSCSLSFHTLKSSSLEYLIAESTGNRVVAITLAPARSIIRLAWYPILTLEPVIRATFPWSGAVWNLSDNWNQHIWGTWCHRNDGALWTLLCRHNIAWRFQFKVFSKWFCIRIKLRSSIIAGAVKTAASLADLIPVAARTAFSWAVISLRLPRFTSLFLLLISFRSGLETLPAAAISAILWSSGRLVYCSGFSIMDSEWICSLQSLPGWCFFFLCLQFLCSLIMVIKII